MFAEQWLEHVAHRIKPITLKRYRELLTVHVVPVIGSIHMTELRPAGVQAVVTKVLEHRSPRTAVNTYRVLSEMLGEGVRWGVIGPTPLSPSDHRELLAPISTSRTRRRVRQFWSVHEGGPSKGP